MPAAIRSCPFGAALALVLLFAPGRAEAQLGGLIKKKATQAAGVAAPGEPVKFTDLVLEITPDRMTKVLAAKRATKLLADAPTGPAALQGKLEAVDARQAAIYEKQVDAINAWDDKRLEQERCFGDALSALQDKANDGLNGGDPQAMQKLMQLAQAMALAQQRGDTAEVRRLTEALQKARAPSRADSLAAAKQCGPVPAPSAIIKQWLDLKAQLDSLKQFVQAAEDSILATLQRISGMDRRQVAIFCERIHLYLEQRKAKKPFQGFSDQELQALANQPQVLKDLEQLCL